MNAFIDTSIVLRKLLREPHPLAEWKKVEQGYASRLLAVELGRVIDRYRLAGTIDDADVAQLHDEAAKVLRSFDLVAPSDEVLRRAAAPMPTTLGTLDAIHLATALTIAPAMKEPLVFLTHDLALARAARASGFEVLGA